MSRKTARDNAFKCIYEYEFNKDKNIDEIIDERCNVSNCLDLEREYIEQVTKGVVEHILEIDEIIHKNLKKWSFSRIAKIDLAILRLAIYEMNYMDNIPLKVSANEAVEIAKTYGNSDSKSFVNGLLAKVIEDKKEE